MASKKQGAEHIGGTRQGGDSNETQHRNGTKTAAAHEIWDGMFKKQGEEMSRSEAIQAAVDKAGMTNASAATLYQNWRNEHGLVDHDNPGGAAANAQNAARGSRSSSSSSGSTSSSKSMGSNANKKDDDSPSGRKR